MNPERWTAVDDYFVDLFSLHDDALRATLAASDAAGLPAISITAPQGKLLQLLAESIGAKRILEIGTLGGYSAIWLARGLLPGGSLVTLEFDPKHAELARANIAKAGLASSVEVVVGRAIETLPRLAPAFDLIFLDADKESYTEYLGESLRLSRPGTLIVADNVVRDGAVIDPASTDPRVQGIRRFNAAIAKLQYPADAGASGGGGRPGERRVSVTAIQTVGGKGYDGFAVARVLS